MPTHSEGPTKDDPITIVNVFCIHCLSHSEPFIAILRYHVNDVRV